MPTATASPRKSRARTSASSSHRRRTGGRKWSAKVTATSDAMTLKKGIFQSDDPKKIARSVKRSSEHSRRRKAGAYRSAVSMISFYENRGGKNLSASKRRTLQRAKAELKKEFGKDESI
jgi:hypothetical protein